MKLNLPILAKTSENTLIGLVFAAIFITGLGIFSLSASVIVSSAFLSVSSLAAYIVAKQRNDSHAARTNSTPEVLEAFNRRLAMVEGSMKTIETRVSSIDNAIHAQVTRQMEPLVNTVQLLADIIDHQHRQSPPKDNPQPSPVKEPSFKPLQKRRIEAVIREGLQSGRLVKKTQDIIALPTARPAYRLIDAQIGDQLPSPMNEASLRAEGIGASIIQLFDRVRFAHAFETASKLAVAADSPVLVCPLTRETLADDTAGTEIVALLSRRPAIAKRLCFLLNDDTLFLDTGMAGKNMRGLVHSGCSFAFELKNDMRIDPYLLQSRGVSLLLSPAALILAAKEGKIGVDIDPMDFVHLLDRHDIDLSVSHIKTDGELRAIRAMGINLILRTAEQDHQQRGVKLRPEPQLASPRLPRVREKNDQQTEIIRLEPEPLKARLRRMSA